MSDLFNNALDQNALAPLSAAPVDETTAMLDQASSAPPKYQDQPQKPSLWKSILSGALLGLVGGAGQKTFAGGVGAGGRYVAEQGQQQVENQQRQQQLDQNQTFRDAQAANYAAEATYRQHALDNSSAQLRASIEAKDEDQVKYLMGLGLKPIAVMENDPKSAMAALQQAKDASPDGKVPPVVTFHYGGKIVAFDLSQMGANSGVLDAVNKASVLVGRPQIDAATWNNPKLFPPASKNKMIADSFALFNPVAAGGNKTYGQIEYYKNLINKAQAMPDTPEKAGTVASLKQALMSLQTAAQEQETAAIRVAYARGAAFGLNRPVAVIDGEGDLVLQTAGQAIQEGSAPAAQGATAMGKMAQFNEIQTGSAAYRQAIVGLDRPFTPDQVTKLTVAAHSNDDAIVGANLSALAKSDLTPGQKNYVVAYTQMLERIMSLRNVAGMGQASDKMRAAIQRTVPSPGSGSKDMSIRQLNALDQQVASLEVGIPKVKGMERRIATQTPHTAGQPKVGDTKKFPNGKTGRWDGKGWVAQ